MNNNRNYKFLLSDLSNLKGVGIKTAKLLKRKNINNIFDLLWKLPKSYTDRSFSSKIENLRIGENQTITIIPQKYSFPRVRNLPNRVLCSDDTGEIECVFFNNNEGLIYCKSSNNCIIPIETPCSDFYSDCNDCLEKQRNGLLYKQDSVIFKAIKKKYN